MSKRQAGTSGRGQRSGAGPERVAGKSSAAALPPALAARLAAKPSAPDAGVKETLGSSGQALDEKSREFFEPKFGHDFSRVRVHTDAKAADSAEAVNAAAYTAGDDIVFGPGRYAPETPKGRDLLAHELSHVAQQAPGGAAPGSYRLSRPDAAAERAAEIGAQRIVSGLPPALSAVADPGVVHRTIKEDLREAISGWGTDEEAIYARLAAAQPEEKKAVMADPVLMQDLYDDLNRGEWGRVLGLLGASTESRVHAASEGWGTDEEGIFEALRTTSGTDLKTQIEGTAILLELRDELSVDELGNALAIITEKFMREGSISWGETYHALMLFPDTVNEACNHLEALGYDVARHVIAHLNRGHRMEESVVADADRQINNDSKLDRVEAAFEARWNIDTRTRSDAAGKAPTWTVALIRQIHRALKQVPAGHVVRGDQDVAGISKGELAAFRLDALKPDQGSWSASAGTINVGTGFTNIAGLTRHEVGHAIDDYLGAKTEAFKKNGTNGWDWMDSSIVWELHMAGAWKRKDGTDVPIDDQIKINDHLDAYVKGDGSGSLRAGAAHDHPIRAYWNDDVPMIEVAKDLAGKKDKVWEHLGSVKKVGGRYYSWSTYYHEFYVYNAIVQEKRLTNYSLFGHPEFFAEMYEAYYEEGAGPERGEKLKGVPNWKQFFDTVVHPTK